MTDEDTTIEQKSETLEFIMERIFESVDEAGVIGTVKLRIGKPYLVSDSNSDLMWRCPYQVIGLGSEKIKEAPGIDAIDALLTSLQFAEIFITTDSARFQRKITWLNEQYLGFPTFPSLEAHEHTDDLFDQEDNPFKQAFDEFFQKFNPKS